MPDAVAAAKQWSAAEWAALAVLLGGFLALKTYALAPVVGDENIYFYMAVRTAEGAIPYRDFFFGHPPLHLLPAVAIAAVAGFHVAALKAVTMVASAAAGFFLWRIVRRAAGPVEATLAVTLYLFSWDVLRSSTHYTAINEAIALLAAGLDAALARRDRTAGALLGAAALTGFYTAPVSAVVTLLRLREDRRGALRLVLWAGGIFLLVNLAGLAAAGGRFLDQVYFHHLRKPEHPGEFWKMLTGACRGNPWLAWSPVMAGVWLAMDRFALRGPAAAPARATAAGTAAGTLDASDDARDPERRRLLLYGFAGLAVAIPFLGRLPQIAAYYFLLAFPFLAILGAIGYGAPIRLLVQAARERAGRAARERGAGPETNPAPRDGSPKRSRGRGASGASAATGQRAAPAPSSRRLAVAGVLSALALAGWLIAPKGTSGGTLETEEPEADAPRSLSWRDSPVLPGRTNAAVRRVFWGADSDRPAGAIARYLRHESRRFEALDPLVAEIRRRVPEGETIFGDSISVPLLALVAGRRVALDDPNTQSVRFRSGGTPPAEMIRKLEAAPPRLVVVRPGWGFILVPEFRQWLQLRYREATVVDDPWQGSFVLYERSPDG